MDGNSDVPVLVLVFNRPKQTRKVLQAIREARPRRLYVAADGPRPGNRRDRSGTEEVRRLVVEDVDWPCEVKTLFRNENLGCRLAVSSAITWFFEQEELGIVLEDDCLPGADFFGYCRELLHRYRDDERVKSIGGFLPISNVARADSYFFSNYPLVWGWASWRRAWRDFSLETEDFETDFEWISEVFQTSGEQSYWHRILGRYFRGEIDTWDYPWAFSIWKSQGVSITPTANLVQNIGFGPDSLHTKGWKDYRGIAEIEAASLGPMIHPAVLEIDRELDSRIFVEFFRQPSMATRGFMAAARAARNRLASLRQG